MDGQDEFSAFISFNLDAIRLATGFAHGFRHYHGNLCFINQI
jgi:hypothetical protein